MVKILAFWVTCQIVVDSADKKEYFNWASSVCKVTFSFKII